jgi:GPH family glycoside/pentoside/hexuronide:cation symporter
MAEPERPIAPAEASPGAAPPSPARAPAAGAPVPLPLGVRLAFGMPSFAGAAMAIPLAIHLTIFYSDVVLVPLGWIALVKALSRAFDAMTDAVMGWVSDRTRSRFGRRRPYMAVGAPAAALAFVALFAPPAHLTPTGAGVWLLACYVLYYLFHTLYIIPHYGLGPELTQDYHERSRLYGLSEAFTVAGTIVAALLPGVLVARFGDRGGYLAFGVLFAALLTLLYWNLVLRIRERPDFVHRPPNPLVPGVRRVMRNRVFRILLAVYVVGSIAGAIPGMLIPYFTKYVLQPPDPNRWLAILLAAYFVSGFVFLPAWIWAARRFGKKPVWLASFVSSVTGSAAVFFVGEGQLALAIFVLIWAGSSFGARLFLGPAIQADVIDYDELQTGKRREAQYGALWSLMMKFTVIPSMALPLAVLESMGFEPNAEQSDSVKLAIRAMLALVPAASALVAGAIACFYPISESVHRQVWEGIERHRRGESAPDPITGRTLAPPGDRGVDEDTGWFLDHFSPRELRDYGTQGPGRLVRGALLHGALWLALAAAAGSSVAFTVGDLSRDIGLTAVLEVVVAGFALTAAAYHAVRLRAALRMRRDPVPPALVARHLAGTVLSS